MTLTVTLTPDLEEIVNQQIATGQYASREEVIVASLHLLRDADARKEAQLRVLLDEADEDVRAGRVAPFDPLATAARVKTVRAARAANES